MNPTGSPTAVPSPLPTTIAPTADEDDQGTTANEDGDNQGEDNQQLTANSTFTDDPMFTPTVVGIGAVLLCAGGVLVGYCCRRSEQARKATNVESDRKVAGLSQPAYGLDALQPVTSVSVNEGGPSVASLSVSQYQRAGSPSKDRVIGPGSMDEHYTPAPPARSPPKENAIVNMHGNDAELEGVPQTMPDSENDDAGSEQKEAEPVLPSLPPDPEAAVAMDDAEDIDAEEFYVP
eukprot:CAMPEP_0197045178 /NCGR_PEP_ID=MMETSP1384-20130603/21096_1 /TAXON_ID=29189 /ORGANISM="Ammonia sp." /LENGTH=233 /DNA_ID=CAMNT_0042476749 /DNA_START=7 /DNA_END=704 /DNA_ORIENTATION=-